MMNRKDMTASTLDETALDTYYTLTEGGANYGIGLALAATLNSFKNGTPLLPSVSTRTRWMPIWLSLRGSTAWVWVWPQCCKPYRTL